MGCREVWYAKSRIHHLGLLGLVIGVLLGMGCDNNDQQARMLIHFSEPVRYRVVAGDDLAAVAARHAVTEADLIAWNSLESAAIEPGETLFIWQPTPEPEEDAEQDGVAEGSSQTPGQGGTKKRASPRPRSAPTPGSVPRTQPEPPPRPLVTLPANGRPTSVRNAGLFGAATDDAGLDDTLANAVAGLQHDRNTVGTAGLRDSQEMRSGQAESSGEMGRVAKPPPRTGPYFPDTPIRTPSVGRPAAKRCLSMASGANTGEDGMYSGKGINSAQIKAAMGRPLSLTRSCIPAGTEGKFSIIMEVKVGCDGRVSNTYPINSGGLPPRILTCIETVLKSASFPAHDIPDGQSFQYPINYNF